MWKVRHKCLYKRDGRVCRGRFTSLIWANDTTIGIAYVKWWIDQMNSLRMFHVREFERHVDGNARQVNDYWVYESEFKSLMEAAA